MENRRIVADALNGRGESMIQIDMPMPTNCLDCPACNEYLMCAIPVYGREWGENDVREFDKSRPQWCPMKEQEWIPISERLPENAEHPGAFCPKVRVLTVWGESYGWYNPDMGAWYFLVWHKDYSLRDIDFERGDIPCVSYTPKDTKLITHWKPIP